MDNLSNTKGINSQPGAGVTDIIEEEIVVDPVELQERIKSATIEIGIKVSQAKDKLEKLYKLKPTKETYDNIISISSIKLEI